MQTALGCAGGVARIEGSRNRVRLSGTCAGLDVRGDGNEIDVEMAAESAVVVAGHGNRIRLAPGSLAPVVSIDGTDNTLDMPPEADPASLATMQMPSTPPDPATLPLPRPDVPEPLVIARDEAAEIANCNGRRVTVQASRARLILRGRCGDVAVLGSDTQVDVELAPGARLAFAGDRNRLRYTLPPNAEDAFVIQNGVGNTISRVGSSAGPP